MAAAEKPSIPILSVVGNSGSGKTVYLEKLIPALKARGLRIGIIKSDSHGFDIDIPGKDSWRMTRAGADITMIASPEKVAVIENRKEKESLEQLAARMKCVDLVLSEGFRHSGAPKIEVRRFASGNEPIFDDSELFAIATDMDLPNAYVTCVPLDNAEPLADIIFDYVKAYT